MEHFTSRLLCVTDWVTTFVLLIQMCLMIHLTQNARDDWFTVELDSWTSCTLPESVWQATYVRKWREILASMTHMGLEFIKGMGTVHSVWLLQFLRVRTNNLEQTSAGSEALTLGNSLNVGLRAGSSNEHMAWGTSDRHWSKVCCINGLI